MRDQILKTIKRLESAAKDHEVDLILEKLTETQKISYRIELQKLNFAAEILQKLLKEEPIELDY